jgi:nephrocystin-3
MPSKKEIRVFISSTFKDLDDERGYLAKQTFPLLRTYCNRKGVHFSEIDLRWGLTEEDSKNGRVLRLCLDQIQDCKPFFIGILGSRYGWIPTLSDLQKDRQLKENYPEVFASVNESRSVVEIEFEQGMLNDPQPEYQFVYAKQQEKRNPRVEELLHRVAEKELKTTEFASLEELHQAVLSDLQSAVDRYLEESNTAWADEDQRAFMTERLRSYIEHSSYSSKIDDQLAQERSMTIITGDSGSGKSALMAHTIERLRQDGKRIVLGHFVGASSASRNARGIFYHLSDQLKRNYEIDLGSTSTFSSLQDEFAFLLSKINEGGAVIAIDALDQLDEDSQPLDWLPEYLPESVHLLVSTTSGPILKRLRQREWDEFAMEPFDREEREAFVVRYLADYGKSLTSDHVGAIASNPKCRNPLFLKMLLEEVRLSAHFTNLDETIDHYLSVRDLDGLFQLMLERMELQLTRGFIERFFASLAASHTGLNVTELGWISETHVQIVQHFVQTHSHLLFRIGDRFTLFHKALDQAVSKRYFSDMKLETRTQAEILDALFRLHDTERLATEGVWLALELANAEKLIELFSIPEVFLRVTDKWDISRPTQLGSHLLKNCDIVNMAIALEAAWTRDKIDEKRTSKLYIDLSKILITAGHFEQSLGLLTKINISTLTTLEEIVEYHNLQGTAYQELGKNEEALRNYESALNYIRNSPQTDTALLLEVLQNLGISELDSKRYDKSTEYFEEAMRLCDNTSKHLDERLATLTNIGAVYYSNREFQQAELYFSKALSAAEEAYSTSDPRLIRKLNNLGLVEGLLGSHSSAIRHLEDSLRIARQVYGSAHLDVSLAMLNLGRVREAQQQYSVAERLYRDALAIKQNILVSSHPSVKHAEFLLNRVLEAQNKDHQS